MTNNMTKQFSPVGESSSRPSCSSSIHRLLGIYLMEAYMWMYGCWINEEAEKDFDKVYLEAFEESEVL